MILLLLVSAYVLVCTKEMNVYIVDVEGHETPDTPTSDYESWRATDNNQCLLGRSTTFIRRKRDTQCRIPADVDLDDVTSVTNCKCTEEDYEWYIPGEN